MIRNIEIIGEASKQIEDEIKDTYEQFTWSEMSKMRDKMIHGYFTIIHDILWETAKHDIPDTKPLIRKILEDMDR